MPISHDTIIRVTLRDRTKLLAYIIAIVRDEHAAEDILQEVSMASVRKIDEIDDERHLLLWLRRAARLESLRYLRDSRSTPRSLDSAVLDAMEPHWAAADDRPSAAIADALRACLAKLSPYARQLMTLRYSESLTGAQIADRLDRQLRTVYIAMSRTRRRLSDCVRSRVNEGGEA